MTIHDHGYWIGPPNGEHHFDKPLADALVELLRGHSVLDVGCGMGEYVHVLRRAGIEAAGVDGNPDTPYLTRWQCCVADLVEPWPASWPYWETVLCLEVLEHIPHTLEEIAVHNVCDYCGKRLILSWAVRGQDGTGHVNCRTKDYVETRISAQGFVFDVAATETLRSKATLPWFQNNLLVFNRC